MVQIIGDKLSERIKSLEENINLVMIVLRAQNMALEQLVQKGYLTKPEIKNEENQISKQELAIKENEEGKLLT